MEPGALCIGLGTRKNNFIIHNSYKNRTTICWNRFVWIQSNHASQYYTERAKLRRKYIKLSLAADVLQQIICTIKIRRAPTRHDSIDFLPLITKISELVPLSIVTADKAYDSEKNHELVRDVLHALSLIF